VAELALFYYLPLKHALFQPLVHMGVPQYLFSADGPLLGRNGKKALNMLTAEIVGTDTSG